MNLRITLDVFSGRENPIVELSAAETREALKRLQPARQLTRRDRGLPKEPTLGYRGMLIEQIGRPSRRLPSSFRLANGDIFAPRAAYRVVDEAFEDFICGAKGPIRKTQLPGRTITLIRHEIRRFAELRAGQRRKKVIWPGRVRCRCAPLYEPQWWNQPSIQPDNNCYNYATDCRTNTYAQPGEAAGAKYTSITCPAVRVAAEKDDLIDRPTANNRCPKEGHLVALVVARDFDYHWYRKGRNGYWTHKPGGGPVTNLDNDGRLIRDPRLAARGPYDQFCTYMVVMHGHVKII